MPLSIYSLSSNKNPNSQSGIIHIGIGVVVLATALFAASAFTSFKLSSASNSTLAFLRANLLGETTGPEQVSVLTVSEDRDLINEDGNTVTYGGSEGSPWIGTAGNKNKSYLGLRFTGGERVPANAEIVSAKLRLQSSTTQWIRIAFRVNAENSSNPQNFEGSKASQRTLTSANKKYSENKEWQEGSTYEYDVTAPVKEAFNSGSDLSSVVLVLKGTGSAYGRKFITHTESNPQLEITYAMPLPPSGPECGDSVCEEGEDHNSCPADCQAPGPVCGNGTCETGEDSNNCASDCPVQGPVCGNGACETGEDSNNCASDCPVQGPVCGNGTCEEGEDANNCSSDCHVVGGGGTVEPGTPAATFGVWDSTRPGECRKADHDTYFVLGPDGKKYPTWHPPVHTRSDGTTCYFGHEHGRNPQNSELWAEARKHFAFDANSNGTIEASELATAGIPFGYVAEQLNEHSNMHTRHEDHFGYKIEYANGEIDSVARDRFDQNTTGGLVVPKITGLSNPKWENTGVRCKYLSAVHQGVHSGDATRNNLHEVNYFSTCDSSNNAYDSLAFVSIMGKFGKVGEFTNLCDGNACFTDQSGNVPEDRTTPIPTSTTPETQNYPGTRQDGARNIITRACIDEKVIVPQTRQVWNGSSYETRSCWSNLLYEVWPVTVTLRHSNGSELLGGANLQFDVLDVVRHYDPSKPGQIGYNMDLCYENVNGERARTIQCDIATDYGNIQGITWDDTRSAFRGVHRGMYFSPSNISNAGGPEYWYTDAFGNNASQTPFPGSIRQRISTANVNYWDFGNLAPRVGERYHNGEGVHAPN